MFEGNRAVGVDLVRHGRKQHVRARREVVISAGAIGSPQILQLSGVGPKEHLEKLKVGHIFVFSTLSVYCVYVCGWGGGSGWGRGGG